MRDLVALYVYQYLVLLHFLNFAYLGVCNVLPSGFSLTHSHFVCIAILRMRKLRCRRKMLLATSQELENRESTFSTLKYIFLSTHEHNSSVWGPVLKKVHSSPYLIS